MTAASVAAERWRKAVKIAVSLFRNRFDSAKCKTMGKLAVARVKLLRNKREAVIRQMRRDIAMLLEKKQDATARVRVEHVIREQNILAANEFIELFCELIVGRLQIIANQKDCPADLKEGISSLIFAGPRCSEIPELQGLREVFQKKYGKEFVSAASDLRPNAGVNRTLIEKLSVRTPSGELKLKVLKEIAKEYQVDWDVTDCEGELLKPPEERIDGPTAFRSASTLPVKDIQKPSLTTPHNSTRDVYHFQDSASAAEAAQKSAKEAIAAAEAAAYLAGKEAPPPAGFQPPIADARKVYRRHSYNVPPSHRSKRFVDSDDDSNEETELEEEKQEEEEEQQQPKYHRRHSFSSPPPPPQPAAAASGIKFDESDYSDVDEEIEMERPPPPPTRDAPQVPSVQKQESFSRVHPKLPDYDTIAARFDALKYRK